MLKRSIHTQEFFRKADFTIGFPVIEQPLPGYSDIALEAWNRTADKALIYKPEDGSLSPSWSNAEVHQKTGLNASIEETKMYVKALAELPRLILHDCGIGCSKTVLSILDEEYSDLSKLMEFHLLRHGDAILRINSNALESLSTRADVSNSIEELIKDIWQRKEVFCQWVKSFSISELWFCCEIETCFEGLKGRGFLPREIPNGKQETKVEAAEKERGMLKILENPGSLKIVYPENAHELFLNPYHALIYSADKLAQQNVFYAKKRRKVSPYQRFLQSFRKHTNYVRKSEKLTRLRLSPDSSHLIFG